MTLTHGSNARWAGAGMRSWGRTTPSDDECMMSNLVAQAWREDPEPLDFSEYAEEQKAKRARGRGRKRRRVEV